MASSSVRSSQKDESMDTSRVPGALRERLGLEATVALVEMVDRVGQEWRTEVIEQVLDRFDGRLVEAVSPLRLQMVEGFAGLRQEIGEVRDELRQAIGGVRDELRQEIGEVRDELRQAIGGVRDELREEIGEVRDELRQAIGGVRDELRQEIGGVRDELRQGIGRLQDELRREGDGRRQDVSSLRLEIGGLREGLATDRFELLKWTFLFWVGQVVAIGSLVALLLRFVRPVG
jgi:archaellum component FlaC